MWIMTILTAMLGVEALHTAELGWTSICDGLLATLRFGFAAAMWDPENLGLVNSKRARQKPFIKNTVFTMAKYTLLFKGLRSAQCIFLML